ncbi:hypothetical protein [uncultured Treponema sp.]|jgi:hypothetical protein|uniref:hypothetical protein n=1 Tax=uncultured Treponema sp. TaxID=162155 RepID=UPI0028E71590|nr:hypothetical protein [uncultured Treponema sp.]
MGSDDASVMTQKELMRQLYSLQKESVENDARLQAEMDGLNRRLDKQERTFEKISEVLAEQKSFFSSLNGMNKKFDDVELEIAKLVQWKHEQEKRSALEDKDDEALEGKFKILFAWKDTSQKRLDILENKNAKTAFELVKKIGGIVLTMIVTAITAYLIGRIK